MFGSQTAFRHQLTWRSLFLDLQHKVFGEHDTLAETGSRSIFLSSYQTVAYLGKGDELLVSWSAHVEADGQHLFKGRDNQGGLDGVVLASTALVLPLLVPS